MDPYIFKSLLHHFRTGADEYLKEYEKNHTQNKIHALAITMAKPTARSTVSAMKDYIRSKKLNKAPILLGMKRDDLIAALRKLGHYDARHDGAPAPRRKPPAPKKPKAPKAPVRAIEDRPAGNDARSKALKAFQSVKGRFEKPDDVPGRAIGDRLDDLQKMEKVLKDKSLKITKHTLSTNGRLFSVEYTDPEEGTQRKSVLIRLKDDGGETNTQKIDRILKANGLMTLTEYQAKIKKILAGTLFDESSAQQRREILQVMKATGLPVPYDTLRKQDGAEPQNLERRFVQRANALEKKAGGAPARAPAQAPVDKKDDELMKKRLKIDLMKAGIKAIGSFLKDTGRVNSSGIGFLTKVAVVSDADMKDQIRVIKSKIRKDLLDNLTVRFFTTGKDKFCLLYTSDAADDREV